MSVAPTTPATAYAARFGVALLVCRHVGTSHIDYEAIVDALRSDSRVRSLDAPPTNAQKLDRRAYPIAVEKARDDDGTPPLPHHHVHALGFSEPIVLHIQVPRRVQVPGVPEDLVPSDEYWVAWNGVVITVSWTMDTQPGTFHSSGGKIVLTVLDEAAKRAGLKLRRQPCGPNCNYPFAHAPVRVTTTPDAVAEATSTAGGIVNLSIPGASLTAQQTVRRAFDRLEFSLRVFAEQRSSARAIADSERYARRELTDLLTLQYERASISARPLSPKRIRDAWARRGTGREARRLEALLWLRLAGIERNHRRWQQLDQILTSTDETATAKLVLAKEIPEDERLVSSLDVSNIRSAVEQIGARVDNRVMVWATGAGAIIGAAAGTLIGRIG